MSVTAQVRATALLDFPAVALELGIDPYAALHRVGIDPASLSRADVTLPADRVAWLLEGVAEKSGVADLAIRIAMRRRLANLGVAGLVLGQQPTVRAALAMAEKYKHLLSTAQSLHAQGGDGEVTPLILGVSIAASAPGRQSRELALAAYVHLFRLLHGEHWTPLTVHFSHAEPKGATLHQRFFRCPVQFGSPLDGFECPTADLDRVNTKADAALASYAAALLDTLPNQDDGAQVGMVTRLIHALLPMGGATIDRVAGTMGRNVRTLQRDLARQGTQFSILLAEARKASAVELLRDPSLSIAAVAERLGYSHPSAFIRFFHAQFQKAPGEWRATSSLTGSGEASILGPYT